jgi:NAD(P)-dependent dehydrogenase (short-subunit alcohol dehydrogenase family)
MPFASAYVTSKHALNRLNEYIHTEHPDVKAFSLNPGFIKTAMAENNPEAEEFLIDTLQLPAATCLRLTSGRDDWLSGRCVAGLTWRYFSTNG